MDLANDVVMLAVVAVFFAGAVAYTALCERWV